MGVIVTEDNKNDCTELSLNKDVILATKLNSDVKCVIQNVENTNSNCDTVSLHSLNSSISNVQYDYDNDDELIVQPQSATNNNLVRSEVNIIDSEHVDVGDKTIYNAPVTINVNKFLTLGDLAVGCKNSENLAQLTDGINQKTQYHKTVKSSDCDSTSTTNLTIEDKSQNIVNGVDNPIAINECSEIKTAKLDDGLFLVTNKSIIDSSAGDLLRKGYTANRLMFSIIFIFFLLIMLLTGVVLFIKRNQQKFDYDFVWKTDTNETDKNSPIDGTNVTIKGPEKLQLIDKPLWLAQPPTHEVNNLTLPVQLVIIHHTATEGCSTRAQCVYRCRHIQTYHIESYGWWDIGYNFLVGGDGLAYVGRGFNKEGAHTFSYNAKSIGIAFIGTFITVKPSPLQIRAAQRLIKMAERLHVLTTNYTIIGARQVSGTVSPGDELYKEIQTWPHWSEIVPVYQD